MPDGNLWETRALPILRYIAAHEADDTFITVGDLADATGIEAKLVTLEVERLLDGGYIPGALRKSLSGGDPRPWFLEESRLTERGARALDLWPQAEQFLQVLEARAEGEPDPARRKALMGVLQAVREVGTSVIGEILATAAKKTIGLS
jgi:hypothetical protein